jgi:hypothetical protein
LGQGFGHGLLITERIDGTEHIITMSIFSLGILSASAAGIATMVAALDRGDVDECARQGQLAGFRVVERALGASVRNERLAAIVAAPSVEDAPELLPALARAASGPDRRTALPAARAACTIAHALVTRGLPDDLAADDVEGWRAAFESIARDHDRFVEVRVRALATAVELAHVIDPHASGFDTAVFAADQDPDVRAAAVALTP